MTSRQLSQKLDLVLKRVSTANVTFGRSGLLAKKCDDIQWFTKSEFFGTSQVLSHNPQRDCCKYLLMYLIVPHKNIYTGKSRINLYSVTFINRPHILFLLTSSNSSPPHILSSSYSAIV